MFAGAELDLVVGLDIHMEMVPMPAPVPTPFPMPFVGMIELSPGNTLLTMGIGAALSWAFSTPPKGPVMVNSLHAAKTGDCGKNGETLPHIVIPPGTMWTPLPKPLKLKVSPPPPTPDNPAAPAGDAIFITGSQTVLFEGSNACRLTTIAMSCGDPVRLPSSVLMAIPKGLPVLVGGPPALDWLAAANAFFLRNKWTAGLLQELCSLIKNERLRNLASWLACVLTGHPVDVASGRLLTRSHEYVIRGPIPLTFERFYSSGWSERDSPLGYGWSHTFDERVWEERGCVVYKTGEGRELEFSTLDLPGRAMCEGQELDHPFDRLRLRCEGKGRFTVRSPDGLVREFERLKGDATGTSRLVLIRNRARQSVTFTYDKSHCVHEVRTSEGRFVRLDHDRAGRLKRLIVPLPDGGADGGWYDSVTFAYSPEGDLVSAKDSQGHAKTYEYDGHLLVSETDRDGNAFYFEYDGIDSSARCVKTWGDDQKGTKDLSFRKITYDLKNRRTFVEDSRKNTTVYEMNVANMVTKTIDPHGAATTREYDDHLRPVAETDALGNQTSFRYDARGNRSGVTLANGATWEAVYSDDDQMLRTTDPRGVVATYVYDKWGRLVQRRTTASEALDVTYDGPFPTQITVSDGATTRLEHDEFGQVVRRVFADGSEERRWYDRQGRVVKVRDGAGRVRRAQYDWEGRLTRWEHPGGNVETFAHSAEGDVVEHVMPGRRIELGYSHYHRLAYREEAGARVTLRRDAEGDLLAVVNEAGEEHRFVRDACGRPTEEISFDGRQRTFVRDALGRVTKEFLPSRRLQSNEYDALSRLTKVTYADGTEDTFAYDVLGQLVEATNPSGTVKLERDARGQVVRESSGNAWVETDRDSMGRATRVRTSMGLQETIARNPLGEVASVGTAAGFSTDFERDGAGLETRRRMPGSVEVLRSWDEVGRPEALVVRRGEERLDEAHYVWRGLDRLVARTDALHREVEEFTHDARGRLSGARSNLRAEPTLRVAGPTGDLYRKQDQSDRIYGKGGVLLLDAGTTYRYDANGNVVQKRPPETGDVGYEWDGAGRLAKVTQPDGVEVKFAYDALGRRVSKTVGNRVTRWQWNGDVPVHEWTVGGEGGKSPELTTWLFEPEAFTPIGKVVESQGASKAYGIVSDYLGTPREMVDEAGRIAWKAQLDVYGVAHIEVGAKEDCPWRWPGQYEDRETGLFYNCFRYYDTEHGGYLNKDPIGLRGGFSAYGYVADPLLETDPLGLAPDFATLLDQAKNSLDFSSPTNGAVFWSGPRMRDAQNWASSNPGHMTLEQTVGGQYLDSLHLFDPSSGLTGAEAAQIWDAASARFASGASGEVTVFATGAERFGPYGERTWWRIEQPLLEANPDVTGITRRRKDGEKCGT